MTMEDRSQTLCSRDTDFVGGVAAFNERRKPNDAGGLRTR
jgi:hypothetical protein